MILSLIVAVALAEVPAPDPTVVAPAPVVAAGPDRSSPPAVIPAAPLRLADPEVHTIGGVTVDYARVKGLRKVQIQVIIDRGAIDLAGKPDPVTEATGYLWDYAAGDLDATALTELEELYDIDASSWMGPLASGIDLSAPPEELDRAIGLLRDVLREPLFPKDEVKRYVREQKLWYGGQAQTSARAVATSALNFSWFPADSPYGVRPDVAAIGAIKSKALLDTHTRILSGSPVRIVVVGDVAWADVEAKLTPVVESLGVPGGMSADPAFTPPATSRVVAVDMPGAEQATVRMRMAAPWRDDPDRVVAEAVDFSLGGAFLSRLNSNLREEKGWTYGAWSSYEGHETKGHWTFGLDVGVEHVAETLAEIGKEVDKVAAEGVRADEIAGARNTIVGDWNATLETNEGAAGFYSGLHFADTTAEGAHKRMLALDAVTPAETQRVAAKWLSPSLPRVWVIVGDRAAIEPQLTAAGITAEWVTPDDAILGRL